MCKKLTTAGVSRSDKSPVFKTNLIIQVSIRTIEVTGCGIVTNLSARSPLLLEYQTQQDCIKRQQIKTLR
jgi:hypothetical protein